MYTKADGFVRTLKKDDDFTVEEKDKQISLTEDGVAKCEAYFNVENFSDPENHGNQPSRAAGTESA